MMKAVFALGVADGAPAVAGGCGGYVLGGGLACLRQSRRRYDFPMLTRLVLRRLPTRGKELHRSRRDARRRCRQGCRGHRHGRGGRCALVPRRQQHRRTARCLGPSCGSATFTCAYFRNWRSSPVFAADSDFRAGASSDVCLSLKAKPFCYNKGQVTPYSVVACRPRYLWGLALLTARAQDQGLLHPGGHLGQRQDRQLHPGRRAAGKPVRRPRAPVPAGEKAGVDADLSSTLPSALPPATTFSARPAPTDSSTKSSDDTTTSALGHANGPDDGTHCAGNNGRDHHPQLLVARWPRRRLRADARCCRRCCTGRLCVR